MYSSEVEIMRNKKQNYSELSESKQLVIYQVLKGDIRYTKSQIWTLVNYGLIIQGALLWLSDFLPIFSFSASIIILIVCIYFYSRLIKDLIDYREKDNEIKRNLNIPNIRARIDNNKRIKRYIFEIVIFVFFLVGSFVIIGLISKKGSANIMESIGEWLSNLGLEILPYSFAAYFLVRWFEYLWKRSITKIVKAIWYGALGITYIAGGIEVGILATYICFIEAWDLLFQHLEIKRQLKSNEDTR